MWKQKKALQKIINILNVVDDNRHVDFPPFSPPSLEMFVNAPQKMSKTKTQKKNFSYIFIYEKEMKNYY